MRRPYLKKFLLDSHVLTTTVIARLYGVISPGLLISARMPNRAMPSTSRREAGKHLPDISVRARRADVCAARPHVGTDTRH